MAQATITPLNFIGRELIATDEPGRFRMGEITELNRESVTNALELRIPNNLWYTVGIRWVGYRSPKPAKPLSLPKGQ